MGEWSQFTPPTLRKEYQTEVIDVGDKNNCGQIRDYSQSSSSLPQMLYA